MYVCGKRSKEAWRLLKATCTKSFELHRSLLNYIFHFWITQVSFGLYGSLLAVFQMHTSVWLICKRLVTEICTKSFELHRSLLDYIGLFRTTSVSSGSFSNAYVSLAYFSDACKTDLHKDLSCTKFSFT